MLSVLFLLFFFSSRRRHTRSYGDWSSDVCSSDFIFLMVLINLHTPLLLVRALQSWKEVDHDHQEYEIGGASCWVRDLMCVRWGILTRKEIGEWRSVLAMKCEI